MKEWEVICRTGGGVKAHKRWTVKSATPMGAIGKIDQRELVGWIVEVYPRGEYWEVEKGRRINMHLSGERYHNSRLQELRA